MNHDLSFACERLESGGFTCVLCKNDTVLTATERGVQPLLQFLHAKQDLRGFSAADRVVGKAAAYLYVLMGVSALYAKVLSKPAKDVLEYYGISVQYETLTDAIRNRTGDGYCPMEQAVLSLSDPKEALRAIERTRAVLLAETKRTL